MTYFPCTESDAGPTIDFIWAGLNLLTAVVIASDPNYFDSPESTVASGLVWVAVSTSAGIVGLKKSKRCRTAKRQLAERQAGASAGAQQQPAGSQPSLVRAVVVEPFVDTLMVGQRVQLVATTHSSSGAVVPSTRFQWTSSSDAVATVSGAGLVTGVAEGTVTIAATSDSVVGTATVTVLKR